MSEFIVVVPEGWEALDFDRLISEFSVSPDSLQDWIGLGLYTDIEPVLREAGMIPEDKSVQEMKIIDNTQLWVRLA